MHCSLHGAITAQHFLESWASRCFRGRLREGAESYAKALASDILR